LKMGKAPKPIPSPEEAFSRGFFFPSRRKLFKNPLPDYEFPLPHLPNESNLETVYPKIADQL
jgi:hypothetical protein